MPRCYLKLGWDRMGSELGHPSFPSGRARTLGKLGSVRAWNVPPFPSSDATLQKRVSELPSLEIRAPLAQVCCLTDRLLKCCSNSQKLPPKQTGGFGCVMRASVLNLHVYELSGGGSKPLPPTHPCNPSPPHQPPPPGVADPSPLPTTLPPLLPTTILKQQIYKQHRPSILKT